jgi:hypothetical protein
VQVDAENADQNTPLHYFVQKFQSPNCQEVGEFLIQKGKRTLVEFILLAPGSVNARNSNGFVLGTVLFDNN